MDIQQRMITFVTRSNWYLFAVLGLLCLINTPLKFALGFVCGGLIVTVNFHLLRRTLIRVLTPASVIGNGQIILRVVLVKYYIRFAVSGVMIFLLISQNIVDPLGLVAGLSVVVASIFGATMLELTRLFIKEAV
ncbi:MAG: ATP synthase subunit I [Pseudomonadota bacterium]